MATGRLERAAAARSGVGVPGLWWKAATGLWMAALIWAAFVYVGPVTVPVGISLADRNAAVIASEYRLGKDVIADDGRTLASAGAKLTPAQVSDLAAAGVAQVTVLQTPFTMEGHGAKAIFFHVPAAWLACLAYVVAAWYAVRYLRGSRSAGANPLDDMKCAAAMELGLLFSAVATVTGSIFSHNEWGSYWSWDPRQTSILIILLIFAAYVVLRGAIEEPHRRAVLSSAYALLALVPGMFLIWVLPRVVATLHSGANNAAVGGGLGGNYRLVLYAVALPAFIGLFTWLFQLRVRLMRLEEAA